MATIQFRRGTSQVLSTKNITLSVGEPVFETDTGRFKIGATDENGNLLTWNELHYQDENSLVSRDISAGDRFPKVGKSNCLYKDESSGKLYQWKDGNYVQLTLGSSIENINTIYGGNANGTT